MRRLTPTDRLIIEKLYNSGCSYRQIARRLNFAVSSIYAEIQRGLYNYRDGSTWKDVKRYSAQIAEDDAAWKSTARGCTIKLGRNYEYVKQVSARILSGESPDAIVGDLRRKGSWTVSTVTLYRYIDMGFIPGVSNKNLLVKSRRKRLYQKVHKAARPPKGLSIERRPAEIFSRCSFGHWEMDTVIGKAKGKDQALLVLTERLTRYELIFKLNAKSMDSVVRTLNRIVPVYPSGCFKSITVDNGCEFQNCHDMEYDCHGCYRFPVYYCHPFSSCERGSNENANRIIRRFFPKGHSLANRTQRDCDAVANFMNNMHRKILGYATPAELFEQHLASLC